MSEVDHMPISALQHILFCERQCALIHLEQQWADNKLTMQGNILHERVDEGGEEKRDDLVIARSVRLSSEKLHLSGIADRVDFFRVDSGGVPVAGRDGLWRPVPVEYKHGVSKHEDWDRVQLCAQGLCLEEMLGCHVESGALFYWKVRRREVVRFDSLLRTATVEAVDRLRRLLEAGITPHPVLTSGCHSCSLFELCQPEHLSASLANKYFARLFQPEET